MPAAVVERRVLGHGGKNWVTSTPGPGSELGGIGALPKYISFIAGALHRSGHDVSSSIAIAVGTVQRWARGEGHVSPIVRKRAAEALAEWEAKKAAAHAKSGAKRAVNASNGAVVSIDLAGFKPSQQRAAKGTATGGQWAAQGGTAPGSSATSQGRSWSKNQIGHYPPNAKTAAQRTQWDNWFRFFAMTPQQQASFLKKAKGKKPTMPKGAPKGPKGKKPGAPPISTAGWAPMPTGLSNGVPVNTVDLADANTTVGGLTDSRSMVVNTLLTKHIRSAHGMKTPKGTTAGRVVKLHKALHARGNVGHSHKGASMSNATQQSFDLATLTTKARKQTRSSSFGLPSERKYPMPDKSHAANAKARAAQQLKAGRITQSQHDRIVRVANKLLGNSSSKNMSNPMADPAMAMGRVLSINLARGSGRKMSPYRPKGAERQRVVEHLRAARALHRSGRTRQAASIHSALLHSATNRARTMADGTKRAHTRAEAKLGIRVLDRQSRVKGTGIGDGKPGRTSPSEAIQAKNTDKPAPKNQSGETIYKRHKSPEPTVATSGDAGAAIQAKSTASPAHGPRPAPTIYGRGGSLSNGVVRPLVDLAGPKGYIHGWIKVGGDVTSLDKHLREHHGYENPTEAGRKAHGLGVVKSAEGHRHEPSTYHPSKARVGEASPQRSPEKFTDQELRTEVRHLMQLNKRMGSNPLRTVAYTKLLGELKKRGAKVSLGGKGHQM